MADTLRQISRLLRLLSQIYLTDPFFYLQVGLFAALTLAAWLLARSLKKIQWRMPGWSWQSQLQSFYFPIFGLVGGRLLSSAFIWFETPLPLFARLYALFWVLFFYRLAVVITRKIFPRDADLVRRRLLLPLALLFVVLRLAGQLNPILRIILQTPIFTFGEGAEAVNVTLSLLIFGPLSIVLIFVAAQALRTLLITDILPGAGLPAARAYAIGTLISYALIAVAVIVALTGFGIDPTTLAVIGSALAVGIGFGLQNTVNNLVSGFLIMFDPMINVGDLVEVSNERGHIRHIGIRNTMIESADGTRTVLPNATLASSPVLNLNSSNRPFRVSLSVPVTTDADPHEVQRLVTTIIEAQPEIRERPGASVTLRGFAQGAMNFQIVFWVDSLAVADPVTNTINMAIWDQLQQRGYVIAPSLPPGPP
jgi:small-conductance mechanosensitive channel